MKQTCPKCKTIVEIDETIYTPGMVVKEECPVCGEQLEFVVPNPVDIVSTPPTPEPVTPVEPKKDPVQPKPDKPKSGPAPTVTLGTPKPKSSKNTGLIVVLVIAIAVIGALVTYFQWYRPYAIDRDAQRTYVLANTLYIRSTQQSDVEFNKLGNVPYGSELITYSQGYEWAEVKWINPANKKDAKKGYVASKYLISKEDFELLHSIWRDKDARETLASTRYRFALIDYYKRNYMQGGSSGWQFYSEGKKAKENYFYTTKIYNKESKHADLFVILKDNSSYNTCRLVAYSFNDETEEPIFRGAWNISSYYRSNYRIKKIQLSQYDSSIIVLTYADDGVEYLNK